MLRIRKEQMMIFDKPRRGLFVARLGTLLKTEQADLCEGWDEAVLTAFVAETLTIAEDYRIVIESDVYEFTVLRLVYGRDWPRHPKFGWMDVILKNPGEPANVRLFQLRDHLSYRAEQESRTAK